MRSTTKENQKMNMEYIKSPEFIVQFLELIEQPLEKKQIEKLNEFLRKERAERHRKAWRKVILG